MRRIILAAAAAIVGCAVLTSAPAMAATDTGDLTVTLDVLASCTITGGAITFTPATAAEIVDGAGTLSVTCSNGAAYTVTLSGGLNYDTENSTRQLKNGSAVLAYALTDADASDALWTTTYEHDGTGNGTDQVIHVGATVDADATTLVGTYTDTVTATITYTP